MAQNRCFTRYQRCPGTLGCLHQGAIVLGGDSDHWNMLSSWILLQLSDEAADVAPSGNKVSQDEHGFLLLSAPDEGLAIHYGPNAIIQILQTVDQLGPGQQFFVYDER